MYLLPAKTSILIFAPFGRPGAESTVSDSGEHVDTKPWIGHVTREDKVLDKHEVWDAVAVANGRDDVPMWARMNVENGYTVFQQKNAKGRVVFGMIRGNLKYLD